MLGLGRGVVASLFVLVSLAVPVSAAPAPATRVISGRVLWTKARWSGYRNVILTESTLLAKNGEKVELVQLGGEVDDVGMYVTHAPPLLQPGDQVELEISTPVANVEGQGPSQVLE